MQGVLSKSKRRVVRMGWNLQASPAHHRFELGYVKIFLQILIQVDF